MVGLQMFHKYMNWRIFFHGFATVGEIVNQIGNPYNNIGLIATLYIRSFVFWVLTGRNFDAIQKHLPEKCCGHKLNNHQHIVLPVNQHECVGNHSGRY
ncbi:uncharacterized protein LOC142239557 isoform X6 [Haematobia irritans]|uniref:uncharacterized protein LOC142233292 isoform X6 n=1 Tax=Haematobia irritans TaxID=7368 RepID=UPI003F503EBE